VKNGKAVGLDNIFVEEIEHFGIKTKIWLLQFSNNCPSQKKIPKSWRKSKVAAVLKPGNDASEPKNCRPISLLSHLYELLERLLLNRLAHFSEKHLIEEKAGFRPGRSTTGQWLNLTQHIDNSYQSYQTKKFLQEAPVRGPNHCLRHCEPSPPPKKSRK